MRGSTKVLCCSEGIKGIVESAVRLLNASQELFAFQVESHCLRLPPPDLGAVYSWEVLTSILAEEKQRLEAEYLFGVLDQGIEHNWFSRTVHDKRICFITTKDWEYLSNLPVDAFVAYEIVENLVEMLLGRMPSHMETRGCLHDMCVVKPHISFKIRTADICAECMDALRGGLQADELDAVIKMLESVRCVALGRQTHTRGMESASVPEMVDREFPFPVAYCFRSMQTEISFSRKWLKLLELYEVIVKYVTFALLSDLNQNSISLPENLKPHLASLRRASAGHWHRACFELIHYLKEHLELPWFTARWIDRLTGNEIQAARTASQSLVRLRNQTIGHGFVEEEARYQELYEQNLHAVQTLINFVIPLSTDYTLLHVGEGLRRRRGVSTFPAKILKGSHPLFPTENRWTRQDVDTDSLLYDPVADTYLSLYPWLVLDHCPRCYREMVFLYDKVDDNCVVMREYPTNHTREYEDMLEEVVRLV